MNTLSLVVTLLSVVAAATAGVLAARVLREDRRRSDARVAALARMSGTATWDDTEPAFLPEPEWHADAPPTAAADAGPREEPNRPAFAGRRLAIAGAIGALVLAAGVIATLGWNGRAREAAEGTGAPVAAAPLELLSLSHSVAEGSLTVSGRVQNPQRGGTADGLTATVFLFGADGAFLTSGRAPLEAGTLAAGSGAPFVVTIPVNGTVARYRVSFRDRAGQAVTHVDKRGPASVARSE
jgi:hypothetical protein